MPEDIAIDQPDSWPETHISGRARDLADRLSDLTLESLGDVYDLASGDEGQAFHNISLTLYTLILEDDYMLASATETTVNDKGSWEHIASLRDHCLEDRQNGQEYFSIRLGQRLEEGG